MVAVISTKEWRFLLGASAVLAVLLFCAYVFYMPANEATLPTTTLTIGATQLEVELATTQAEREQGLSGRAALLPGHGMFFTFDTPGAWGIWMKDMKFPIDIIWADEDGLVITIEENATPESYPKSFYPTYAAQYVLEVPAGFVKERSIAIGQQIVVK
jgi:hypothetical protein